MESSRVVDTTATSAETAQWVADVEGAARAGDWRKASAWADRALALGISHPRFYQIRGIALDRAGRLDESLIEFGRAYALDTSDPGIANGFGAGLRRARRFVEAITVLRGEVSQRPEIAESWLNLGNALLGAGGLDDARVAFERAAILRPDMGEAFGKLAVLALHRGDAVAGRDMAERALTINPDDPDARRALIEAAIETRQASEAETLARGWLGARTIGPNGRFQAYGLLGDALEQQARYAEAFAAYGESKTAFAATNAGAFRALDTTPLAVSLAGMRREFEALPAVSKPAALRQAEPHEPRTHVFLMGFMRSGTTLLEQALSLHPDVATLEETEALANAGAALLGQPGGFSQIASMDPATVARARSLYFQAVRDAGVEPAGKVLIDKLPFNGIKLPLIAKLFPEARIVFAIRDPRDVVLSCFQKRLQPNGFSYEMRSLEGAARFYASYMDLVRAYRARLPLSILDHRHEALIADFEGSVREACDFIGLDFRADMIGFHATAREGKVMSQTSRQLREGLNAKGLGRWRRYAAEMAPVLPILDPWVRAHGYD
jgi:tetratricopeptide (TPR) repeat protein